MPLRTSIDISSKMENEQIIVTCYLNLVKRLCGFHFFGLFCFNLLSFICHYCVSLFCVFFKHMQEELKYVKLYFCSEPFCSMNLRSH